MGAMLWARAWRRQIAPILLSRPPREPNTGSGDIRERSRKAKLLALGDTVVVERAVSQNTHLISTAPDDLVSVRALATPTRSEIEALAEIFDQYRAHYGEASDSSRSACWLDENLSTGLRVFVAEESGRFVGFAITMEVPASLRLAHFWQIRDLFVLPTHRRLGVGRALLASVRAAAIASGALRLVVQTEDDNDPALRLYADSGYAPIKGYCSLKLPLGPEPR
jgi:GNAT superfamily N-acetyltransferase